MNLNYLLNLMPHYFTVWNICLLIITLLFSNRLPNYIKYVVKISIISFSILGYYILEKNVDKASKKYNLKPVYVQILNIISHILPLIIVLLYLPTKKIILQKNKVLALYIYSIFTLTYLSIANPKFAYDYVESPFRTMMLGSGIFNILFGLLNY